MNDICAGDLVIAVRGCGCYLGAIYRVRVVIDATGVECNRCDYHGGPTIVAINDQHKIPYCHPLSWLKKIDPISESEPTELTRRLNEPA